MRFFKKYAKRMLHTHEAMSELVMLASVKINKTCVKVCVEKMRSPFPISLNERSAWRYLSAVEITQRKVFPFTAILVAGLPSMWGRYLLISTKIQTELVNSAESRAVNRFVNEWYLHSRDGTRFCTTRMYMCSEQKYYFRIAFSNNTICKLKTAQKVCGYVSYFVEIEKNSRRRYKKISLT